MSRLRLPDPSRFFTTAAANVVRDIIELINGRLFPADNFQQVVLSGTSPVIPGVSFVLQHGLGRSLAGTNVAGDARGAEFVYWLDGAGSLYLVTSDLDTITLKCTDASRNYTVIVR
jgi:hypothetical protein